MKPFKIRTMDGLKTVEGHTSEMFGWHLSNSGMWQITHLPTGFAVGTCQELKSAEIFVETAETFPEWKDVVIDEPDETTKVIIHIPPELTKKVLKLGSLSGVTPTTGHSL